MRESDVAYPSPADARRLYVWNRADGKKFLLATANELYALDETAGLWRLLYTFGASADAAQYDFQALRIASTEYLVVARGVSQMAKWDGASESAEAFGSAEGLSDCAVNFVELYYSRLFAAGDADYPSRLYYSQAPGDERTVENWASAEESANVGGGHVEIGTDSDPITGLFALSSQLLIFKRDSLFRLRATGRATIVSCRSTARCSSRCTRAACAWATCCTSSPTAACTISTARPSSARRTRKRCAIFFRAPTSPPAPPRPAGTNYTLP